MTIIELKDIMYHKIAAINDKSFLAAINTMLDAKYEKLIYKLSPEQRLRIKEGQDQLSKGELLSHDQVMEDIDKWLDERQIDHQKQG
jgi:predicted transcriptional regulator